MAETHELRLKIDAAAAKRGSAEYVGAIKAVQAAIKGLERDSTGTFKKLRDGIKSAQGASKIKVASIDKASISAVDSYTKKLRTAFTEIGKATKGTHGLRDAVDRLASSYSNAKISLGAYNTEIIRNLALMTRQRDLAGQVGRAMGAMPSAPAAPRTTSTGRGGSAGGNAKDLSNEEALRNRITRAIDNQRAATVTLMAQLSKVGATGEVKALEKAYDSFESKLRDNAATARTLDNATTRLNATQKSARVVLTTMNQMVQEQRKSLEAAASAATAQAKAFDAMAKSARAAATAQSAVAKESTRLENLQLNVNKAMRSGAEAAQRMGNRMNALGDTSGFSRLEAANRRLNKALSGGISTTLELKRAVSAYEAELHDLNLMLLKEEGAHKKATIAANQHARAQRELTNHARQIEAQMRSQAGAANATSRSFNNLTGNMRGLENAFNATYQAGTLFRNMLGGLTLGTFVKSVYDAGTSVEQFAVTMEIATGSAAGAFEQMDFIGGLASKFGTDLRTAREDFSKFAVASDLSGVAMADTQKIFESVSMALSVMGRGADDQRLAFLALEQMMSKNSVSSEELRRQLGERLPGAVNLMAKAVGVTTAELGKMLKAGSLVSADVLPKFADEVNKAFGPGMEKAVTRAQRNLGTLKNEFEILLSTVADSGFMDVLSTEFAKLTKMMRSTDMQKFAKDLSTQLGTLATVGSEGLKFLVDNIDSVREALSFLLVGFLASKGAAFLGFLATAGQQTAAFAQRLFQSNTANAAASAGTDAYTAALLRNAQMAEFNSVRQAALARGVNSVTASQQGAAAAALLTTKTIGAATGRIGAFAGVLGTLSAGFSVLAPLIGVAAIAMSAYSIYTADAAIATEDMESRVEGALRRSGARFEDFSSEVRDSAAKIAKATNLRDFVSVAGGGAKDSIFAGMKDELEAVYTLSETLEGRDPFTIWNKLKGTNADDYLKSLGLTVKGVEAFSVTSEIATKNMITGLKAVKQNTLSATAYRIQLAGIAASNSELGPLVDVFIGMADKLAVAERAANNLGEAVVSATAGDANNLLLGLTKAGAQAIDSGNGVDEFRASVEAAAKASPQLASELTALMNTFDNALKNGTGESFKQAQLDLISPQLATLRDLATAQTKAQAALVDARQRVEDGLDEARQRVYETTGNSFQSTANAAQIDMLIDDYQRLASAAAISAADVSNTFNKLSPPTDKMQVFTGEVIRQFTALNTGQQNYAELTKIIDDLAVSTEYAGRVSASYAKSMADAARIQSDASLTAEELHQALIALNIPDATIQQIINDVAHLADGFDQAAKNTRDATVAVDEASEAMLKATGTITDVERALIKFARAMETIQDTSKAVKDVGEEFDKLMEKRRKMAGLDGIELEMFEAMDPKKGEIGKVLAELDEQIKSAQQASRNARGTQFESKNQQQLNDLMEERRQLEIQMQEELRTTLTLEEAAAKRRSELKKAETARNRGPKLTDYAKDLKKLADARDSSIQSLQAEALALQLVNTGQAKNLETAKMLAAAKLSGDAASARAARLYMNEADAVQALVDQQQKLFDLKDELRTGADEINLEVEALRLLVEGQADTIEHAELLARAQETGVDATIAQTEAFIAQSKAANLLKEKLQILADDPVKDWIDSVPTWIEAGNKIETEAIGSLSETLSEAMTTGAFDIKSLGESLLKTVNDVIADMAIRELLALLNLDGSGGNKAGTGLGGMLQSAFGHSAGSKFDPKNGGMPDTTTKVAIVEGGTTAGGLLKNGVVAGATEGARILANAISTAGPGQNGFGENTVNAAKNAAAAAASGKPITDWLEMNNSSAVRNKELSAELVKAMSFLGDMGIKMRVNSGGQDALGEGLRRTGSTRHDHGMAADATFFKDGRQLDWANPEDQGTFQQIVGNARLNGITGIGAGDGYMGKGSMHIGYGAEGTWGAGGKGSNAPGWLNDSFNNPSKYAGGTESGGGGMATPQAIGEAMRSAGTEVSTKFTESFQLGGEQFTESLTTATDAAGLSMGQNVTTAGQQAGLNMGQSVTTAGVTGGLNMGTQVTTASSMGATQMGTGISTSGQGAALQMQAAITAGGSAAAAQMGAASSGGGGGGGGGGGTDWASIGISAGMMLLSSVLNKPKDRDEDNGPTPEFVPVESYAKGTANTSGIPAMLHDNEAVIPLTGGRKVGVELSGDAGNGGKQTIVNQTFNITTPDANSFRKSQKQVAADMASSGQKAMSDNR